MDADQEQIAAESRASARRLPFMIVGGLAILLGFGLLGAGLHLWPWVVASVIFGIIVVVAGELYAGR